ncbi:PAAR domain-containing protein, partial [Pectobacterium parmentieri]
SKTVFAEGNPVSRAEIDAVLCDKHNGPQLIAQGSATVFVEGYHAARVDDKTVCGATIKEGASTVFFGSGQASPLKVEDEFSGWQKALILAVEFLMPPSRGLFRGLGKLFTKGPMAVLRGMQAGASFALKGLRSAVECAKNGFKESKGLARVTESIRGFLK